MKKFYTKIGKSFISQTESEIKNAKNIVITSHISPDDDAISSVLSMYIYVTKYLKVDPKQVRIMFTGKENTRWSYFEKFDRIVFVEDIADHLEKVDLLIMLDGSGWYRFSKKSSISEFSGKTICIDHHPNPEDKHDLHLLVVKYVSCAEIIYKAFLEKEKIDPRTAEVIFLGIWGDTGGLKFIRPDEVGAFTTIQKLISIGNINIQTLTSQYQKINLKTFRLISALMKNTEIVEVKGWPAFQWSYLEPKFLKYGYTDSEYKVGYSVYLDQYMRMIAGADWGFVIIPKETKECGISLRSLPESVNVRVLAEQFNGGGHDRAAGGSVKERNPRKVYEMLLAYMRTTEPVLK